MLREPSARAATGQQGNYKPSMLELRRSIIGLMPANTAVNACLVWRCCEGVCSGATSHPMSALLTAVGMLQVARVEAAKVSRWYSVLCVVML